MAIYKLTRKTFSEELKKMYELKKAGMVGAGVDGTALLAKGLFGGKKQQQAAN